MSEAYEKIVISDYPIDTIDRNNPSCATVQLRAFHHVAISGGFSRAAEQLRLTQPAISDQVRGPGAGL